MITRSEAMSRFLQMTPMFQEPWNEYLAEWEGQPPGACLDFSAFSEFIHDAIVQKKPIDLAGIFAFIELCLQDGDEAVQGAAATCFLEHLQNKETPTDAWVHLLGPRSVAFCRAWDAFTGVSTPGL